MIDIEKAKKFYKKYISNYNPEDPKIALKIAHIYRTAEKAKEIAVNLGLSEEDIKLAELIGMLHDIGRFEQIKQYHTFADSKSINHGEYGVKVLFEDGVIKEFIEDRQYDDIIYKAIINHNKNKTQYQTISNELASVIKQGLYYSELSKGTFDITIGAVSSLWDFKSDKATLPNETLLKESLKTVNYQNIICDHKRILYKNPDTMIDLGAIAKGYIADKLKEYLIQHKVNNALINLGGNILCVGDKMTEGYRIGITNPQKTDESIISTKIEDKSVVTSGIYQRQMKLYHHVYHHILNPRTGYSYDNGLASVTIISPSSMQGDALSTVCFSLGLEKGKALIESLDDVEACFIDTNNQITYTKNFNHS